MTEASKTTNPTGLFVDLNADLGESFGAYTIGNDDEMLKIISSANIACGFHGGDPQVMHKTLQLAKANGVGIGAHPGYNDLWGFGRRQIVEKPDDLEKSIIYQIGAIQGMAKALGTKVTHCKLHGALSNMACRDIELARAAARAIKAIDDSLIWLVLPGTELERAGKEAGLTLAREIFADRAYEDDGQLVSRADPEAMIEDADEAAARMVRFVQNGALESRHGKRIPVAIDSICVHGDGPSAVAMAHAIRKALTDAGITIRPMAERG